MAKTAGLDGFMEDWLSGPEYDLNCKAGNGTTTLENNSPGTQAPVNALRWAGCVYDGAGTPSIRTVIGGNWNPATSGNVLMIGSGQNYTVSADAGHFPFSGSIDECFFIDRPITQAMACRMCSCGVDGTAGPCLCDNNDLTQYLAGYTGRNVTNCDSCSLSLPCNAALPDPDPISVFGGSASGIGISTTLYVSPVGADTVEGRVQVPTPASTYRNLRCVNTAIQGVGNDITVTVNVGNCGVQAATMSCTINGAASGNQACSDLINTAAPSNGQCMDIKIVTPAALTANAAVNCEMEVIQ